jgi:hypothetical protein
MATERKAVHRRRRGQRRQIRPRVGWICLWVLWIWVWR